VATDSTTKFFEQQRPLLTGVAYRMLGRAADAEDVVQDAWLRWSAADRADVREPRAYLVRITTRLAIDRLRHLRSRREAYVGPWLPEPVATDFADTVPDAAERAVLAESVSFAVLVVLESLSPLERAVFVLREAFGFPYGEIAAVLDRAEPAVRQLAGRARRHVEERKPRFRADPAEQRLWALGPMAVEPSQQRWGVGAALVRAGIDACRERGGEAVFVLGHATYYPRFGFRRAGPLGFSCVWPVPEEVFRVLELRPGALEGRSGQVLYEPEFSAV